MKFKIFILAIATLLSSCGGGGGASSSGIGTSGTTGPTTYAASASAGELITYTLDTNKLSYSYVITESAWGLAGQTGSGTLIRNQDGTYTPSEASDTRLVLGNGILIGAIRRNIGGSSYTLPFLGTTGQVTSTADLAGTYNYLHRVCSSLSSCSSHFGSIIIDNMGNWQLCEGADLNAASPNCTATRSGAVSALGNGRFQLQGSTAQMWGVRVGSSKLVVVDDYAPNGGQSLIATEQSSFTSGSADGNWFVISPTAQIALKMSVRDNTLSVNANDVISFGGTPPTMNSKGTFNANSPWNGLAKTPNGGVGLISSNTSFYGYTEANGHFEFGIKMQ